MCNEDGCDVMSKCVRTFPVVYGSSVLEVRERRLATRVCCMLQRIEGNCLIDSEWHFSPAEGLDRQPSFK